MRTLSTLDASSFADLDEVTKEWMPEEVPTAPADIVADLEDEEESAGALPDIIQRVVALASGSSLDGSNDGSLDGSASSLDELDKALPAVGISGSGGSGAEQEVLTGTSSNGGGGGTDQGGAAAEAGLMNGTGSGRSGEEGGLEGSARDQAAAGSSSSAGQVNDVHQETDAHARASEVASSDGHVDQCSGNGNRLLKAADAEDRLLPQQPASKQ